MALIKCTECGKEISDSAEHCPNCGCKTSRGQTVTKAKLLAANWAIVAILMIVGVIFVFTSLSTMGDYSSRYWESGRWTRDGEAVWAVIKLAMGAGAIIGGIYDMWKIKKNAEHLNNYESQKAPVNPMQNVSPAFIPEEKRKRGVCKMCNTTGVVATCKVPSQFGDLDLCPICIRRHNAKIKE